jgi:tetratricopeptide (TPR) repeat protein
MKKYIVFICICFVVGVVCADVAQTCKQADVLDENGEFIAEKDLLIDCVAKTADPKQRAELYWRLARTYLNMGDDNKTKGMNKDNVLTFYKDGEQYANLAIENDQRNPEGFFWKAANIGSWGNTKGILEALGNAGPMKDHLEQVLLKDADHADAYFVLCQLYTALPGWPVSFGNIDYAVSFGRRALFLLDKDLSAGTQSKPQYGYYTALASALWNRNWDINKRYNEKSNKLKEYTGKSNPLEKNAFFECQVSLKPMSDRDEAKELVNWVINEIEKIQNKSYFQKKDLREARKLLNQWG